MPPPTNTKGLRRFLGLCNYIRHCIPSMPAKTEALRALLKKYIRLTKQYTGEYKTLKSLLSAQTWCYVIPFGNPPVGRLT
jgi:hypothetical protein